VIPGAGTGGATKAIFREIDRSFKSYTYTDISAAFFENAARNFSMHKDRMIFKTFDAEKDPVSQGFVEGTYDLVVAFFVIHATSDLERALRHIRRMLKPGGFLVVGEGQEGMNGVASSGFIFGTLPGWWLGTDTGRVVSPHVSPQEWNDLLKKTGFSGVDSCPRKEFEDVLNVFHFSSQAVDEEVEFFREPLSSTWQIPPMKKLVIVGGQTERSLHLVDGMKSLLAGHADVTYTYKSLVDVDYEIIDNDSTVVSFTELDEPVFENIDPKTFQAFKTIFQSDKNLLWITRGRRDDEPYSNMTVGFGRVASHESPGLRLQQLDIVDPAHITPRTIAEVVLRFHAGKMKKEKTLWSVEPEIVVDKLDRQLVARLRPMKKLNQRYNSARRTIVQHMDVSQLPVTLQHIEGGYAVKEQSRYDIPLTEHHSSEELIELHTLYVMLSAIKTAAGYKHLIIGERSEMHGWYLALVPSLTSNAKVPLASTVFVDGVDMPHEVLLRATAAQIVAMTAVGPLLEGQTLLAHNTPIEVAAAISVQSATKGVNVIYTTDCLDTTPETHIRLPQYLSCNDLAELLLVEPSGFIGLSHDTLENEAALISALPANCFTVTKKTMFAHTASTNIGSTTKALADVLQHAVKSVKSPTAVYSKSSAAPISLARLAHGDVPQDPLTVVDWRAESVVPVQAARLDSSPMFKSVNATYWVVGMAGALGISLCDWMISAGARNVVITTRNPKIAPEWIAAHKKRGAIVTVLPW
jgi:SAM-dependent methyltransferase